MGFERYNAAKGCANCAAGQAHIIVNDRLKQTVPVYVRQKLKTALNTDSQIYASSRQAGRLAGRDTEGRPGIRESLTGPTE